jgi:WD40 repeat protein
LGAVREGPHQQPVGVNGTKAELGRHIDEVTAIAVLPDGRIVTGGHDHRVLVWDATTRQEIAQVGCPVIGLAAGRARNGAACLVIAHAGQGFTVWSVTEQRR